MCWNQHIDSTLFLAQLMIILDYFNIGVNIIMFWPKIVYYIFRLFHQVSSRELCNAVYKKSNSHASLCHPIDSICTTSPVGCGWSISSSTAFNRSSTIECSSTDFGSRICQSKHRNNCRSTSTRIYSHSCGYTSICHTTIANSTTTTSFTTSRTSITSFATWIRCTTSSAPSTPVLFTFITFIVTIWHLPFVAKASASTSAKQLFRFVGLIHSKFSDLGGTTTECSFDKSSTFACSFR